MEDRFKIKETQPKFLADEASKFASLEWQAPIFSELEIEEKAKKEELDALKKEAEALARNFIDENAVKEDIKLQDQLVKSTNKLKSVLMKQKDRLNSLLIGHSSKDSENKILEIIERVKSEILSLDELLEEYEKKTKRLLLESMNVNRESDHTSFS